MNIRNFEVCSFDLELDHWSSYNGCHEDCPACAAESDEDGDEEE